MSPNTSESNESFSPEPAQTPRWIFLVFLVVFALVGYILYAGYTSRQALEASLHQSDQKLDQLSTQLEQANNRLVELRGQLELTAEKLGLTQQEIGRARAMALGIEKERKAADERLSSQLGQVKQESETKIGQVAGDVGQAKSDIAATRKDLEETKGKLERTIGDLGVQSGLIARNREEVEELKRRGERNVFEFDLRKTQGPQRVGPIQVQLKKTDPKKSRYTMDVFADDKRIEKKDKTANEPVQFYVRGAQSPFEIVVFQIDKDRAVGYLTTPKATTAAARP